MNSVMAIARTETQIQDRLQAQDRLEEDLTNECGMEGDRKPFISQLRKQIHVCETELKDLQDRSEFEKVKLKTLEKTLFESRPFTPTQT